MRLALPPLILGLSLLIGCADEPPQRPPIEVVVSEVGLNTFQPRVTYVGRLQAKNDVAIQAKVSGYVKSREFQEGQVVAEGSVLYILDSSEHEATLARAKADLAAAVAQQANALRTYNRGLELVSKGAISQSEMDNFEAQKLDSDAGIEAAKAEVYSAQVNLDFTTITAPITGRTGESAVSVGDLVGPSSGDLTTLVSLDPIEAQFQITEATYLSAVAESLSQGGVESESVRRIEVTLELSNGETYPEVGEIDYISNRIDQATGTLRARARIPNTDSLLVPGQYVRLVLRDTDLREAMFIPQAAVQADQRGSFILVVEEGTVVRRDVELGDRMDDQVIVTKGTSPGAQVIVRGLQQVRPGLAVTTRSVQAGTES